MSSVRRLVVPALLLLAATVSAAPPVEQDVLDHIGAARTERAFDAAEKLVAHLVHEGYGDKQAAANLARALVLRQRAAELTERERIADASGIVATAIDAEAAAAMRKDLDMPDVAKPEAAETGTARPRTEGGAAPSRPSDISPPRILRKVEPVYSRAARNAGAQGVVRMECRIDPQGRVHLNEVLESADPVLLVSCVDSVLQWRYAPARKGGEPIEVFLMVRLAFDLTARPAG